MPLAAGTRLHTYEILGPLGAGGMGEVYRARDTRLGRDIALKVLPAEVATDADRLARFEREARTVAGLNHPNIVTLHSVEDLDGVRFFTMELVEGQSLDRAVTPGGLPIPQVVELGIALADALAAAHEKGIVHRDLKPANVMLTKDGRVKVLDFGLAKPTGPDPGAELTQAATMASPLSGQGQVVGTAPYMAPEQLRGESVDARTDLFALGVVLYELASGTRPFAGETYADISSAILRDVPKPLRALRAGLSPELDRIVSQCLEKSPRDRTASAMEVGSQLRRMRSDLDRGGSGTGAWPVVKSVASIAVLPFVNRSASADDEYFSDGLADELLNVLAKIKGLRVTARTSSFHFKGKDRTIAEIGKALDVATVLEGSVRKSGDRARISVQLVRVSDSSHLWAETYDRTLDDIFAVQDDIAQSVVKELRTTLLGEKADSQTSRDVKADLAVAPGHSSDPEAYDFYLRGRHQVNRRSDTSLRQSIELFGKALARDPSYALAELGLAEAHALLGFHEFEAPRDAFPRARAAANRALALMPGLGEAHMVLGYTALHHDRDWQASEREFLRAIELNPHHAVTRLWYVNLLLAAGRFEEAHHQCRRALDLDPLSMVGYLVVAWVFLLERRFEAAEEKLSRALELEPGFFQARAWRALVLRMLGRAEGAAADMDAAGRLTQHPPTILGCQAAAEALHGRPERCRELIARMIALRDERYVSGFHIAMSFMAVGDLESAEQWIERAAADRSPWVNYLNVDPRVDPLRGRPRIQAILGHLGRGA